MLKLILIDRRGCGSALLAAYFLTGKLGVKPDSREILQLPFYEEVQPNSTGDLHAIGTVEEGYRVFALDAGSEASLIAVSAEDILGLLNVGSNLILLDLSMQVSLLEKACWSLLTVDYMQFAVKHLIAFFLVKRTPGIITRLSDELASRGLQYSFLTLKD